MFKNRKIIYALFCLIIISIICFTAVYIVSVQKDTPAPVSSADIVSSSTITESEETVQAEIIYYDKSWYDAEIVNWSDVILPYSNISQSYLAETVFVGDSNTEGLSLFGHLATGNVIGKHSMPVQDFATDGYQLITEDNPETEEDESQYITMLQVLANTQPKRIIINFGTNNAGKGADEDYFAYLYSQALMQIKTVCPNTQIIIAAVLPVCVERANYSIRQDVIDRFNISLAALCRDYGYGFLNYNEVFKDAETGYANPTYFSSDGIHLNGSGYRLLLDYAVNHQYN